MRSDVETRDRFGHATDSPPSAPGIDDLDGIIETVLRLVRIRLGLDVSFVSHLEGGRRTIRYVDSGQEAPIAAGDWSPASDSYCAHVIDGSLPQFLRDPTEHPVSAAMDATYEVPVGTHLSVPIELSNGETYGTLCSFGYTVHEDLGQGDLDMLRTLAGMIALYVEEAERRHRADLERTARLLDLVVDDGLVTVLQPIVAISTGRTVGFEALSRFPTLGTGPAEVFAEARHLGIGPQIELKAAEAALDHVSLLPSGTYLAINLGPETIASDGCLDLLAEIEPGRIIVEVTEHAVVDDYDRLLHASRALKECGVRLAIDDVGTGYSGLDRMLRTQPDLLKLDGALVSGADTDPAKQAIIAALQTYAARIGTDIVAERVETPAEHATLSILGVAYGQGYHYAKPASPHEIVAQTVSAARDGLGS